MRITRFLLLPLLFLPALSSCVLPHVPTALPTNITHTDTCTPVATSEAGWAALVATYGPLDYAAHEIKTTDGRIVGYQSAEDDLTIYPAFHCLPGAGSATSVPASVPEPTTQHCVVIVRGTAGGASEAEWNTDMEVATQGLSGRLDYSGNGQWSKGETVIGFSQYEDSDIYACVAS